MQQRNASSTTNAQQAFKERSKDDDGRLTITLDLIKQGPPPVVFRFTCRRTNVSAAAPVSRRNCKACF